MQHNESKVKKIEEILIKVQEGRNLKDMYKRITDKEIEIADVVGSLDALSYERQMINQDKLVMYRSFRVESSSSHGVATMVSSSGAGVGLVTSMLGGATLLTMGAFALGGAALGAGAVALNSYIQNNWLSPRSIEYKDVPFVEAKPVFSGGKFTVLESNPERGIYRACFYSEVAADAKLTVEVWANTKQLPWNAKRIVEIDKSLEINQQILKTKKDELAALNRDKEILVKQEVLREEAAKKARYATLFKSRESLVADVVSSDQVANDFEWAFNYAKERFKKHFDETIQSEIGRDLLANLYVITHLSPTCKNEKLNAVDFSKIYNESGPASHPWDTKDPKQKFENEIHNKHINVLWRTRQHTDDEFAGLKQKFATIAHNYHSGKRLYSEQEEAAPHPTTLKAQRR